MTLLEVLRSTTDYFGRHHVENPRLNAELLLAHALGRKRIELYMEFERALSETELAPIRDLVRRRGAGEPLQHLTGSVEFCGHEFLCDKRALVPRPETEELVQLIAGFEFPSAKFRLIDVGTGSGVIAISLALLFPEASVYAIDLSEDALALARQNSERLGVNERIHFMKGDFAGDDSNGFDLVVANLPYVGLNDRATLSREVLRDPEIALFGGEIGDELVRKLIEEAPSKLVPGGLLALEIGLGQSDSLRQLLQEKNFHDIEAKNDYAGIPRFLLARYG